MTLDAKDIVKAYPHTQKQLPVALGQLQHRIDLINFWDIKEGEGILEVGCGQGDCTVVLASAVGEKGHITAVDPAPLDYGKILLTIIRPISLTLLSTGSPYTLQQAHEHIRASSIGQRIDFFQADPLTFLRSTEEKYSTAIIAHCIWYFSSPSILNDLLAVLANRVRRICVAEYALAASGLRGIPHVLASLTQAAVESHKPNSISNIRTVLSPDAIKESARVADLFVLQETTIVPTEGMLDGVWEVNCVLGRQFNDEVNRVVVDQREKAVIKAMQDSVRRSLGLLTAKGEKVRTMDVWIAVLSKQ